MGLIYFNKEHIETETLKNLMKKESKDGKDVDLKKDFSIEQLFKRNNHGYCEDFFC